MNGSAGAFGRDTFHRNIQNTRYVREHPQQISEQNSLYTFERFGVRRVFRIRR